MGFKYETSDIPLGTYHSRNQMVLAVGTTICHAFMQAMGMVNDYTVDCLRHQQIKKYLRVRYDLDD